VALITQRGPDEPANSWVFWAVVAVLVLFVVVVILARLTG
jgi:hypothetical protein